MAHRLMLMAMMLWGVVLSASAADDGRAIGIVPATAKFASVAAEAPGGNTALFVGINQFTQDTSLRPLSFAVNDAVAQAYLFVIELKLIPAKNCYLSLAGEPGTDDTKTQLTTLEQAGIRRIDGARAAILRALLAIEQIPAEPADLLIVSISSHGFEDRGVPYAMPADGLRGMLEDTAISLSSVEQRLARAKAGKRLMLIDACRERPATDGKGGDLAMTSAFRSALASAEGQATLASCDVGQVSYENAQFGHGVFTHYLLQALRGQALADQRGFITLGQVSDYVARGVADWVTRNKPELDKAAVQRPWFKGPKAAEQIPLAVDPGIRARQASFKAQTDKTIEVLKLKIDRKGKFNAALYEKLAEALEAARDDESGRELLANAREFAEGRAREAMFVAYVERLTIARPPAQVRPDHAQGPTFTNTIGMKFVRIEAGEFMMGSELSPEEVAKRFGGEAKQFEDEHPRHRVCISTAFYLGTHEVTRGQFAQFVRETSYQTDAEKKGDGWGLINEGWKRQQGLNWKNPGFDQTDEHPVVLVSWNDAVSFCQWLSKKEGKKYRLPTEAQWEYACRAGRQTIFPWGDDVDSGKGRSNAADQTAKERFPGWASFNWADGFVYTAPVGYSRANDWGLYDMIGNAAEWCSDWYGAYPRGAVDDPQGAENGPWRVLRGGAWGSVPGSCRAAIRRRDARFLPINDIGFRVALDSP